MASCRPPISSPGLSSFSSITEHPRETTSDPQTVLSPSAEVWNKVAREDDKSKPQKAAEADVESFRVGLGPFVVAAETTRMPMIFTDAKAPGNPIVFANGSFLALTGYSAEEAIGRDFDSLMAEGADPEALALIQAAFEDRAQGEPALRYCRRDGTSFWASLFVSSVRDETGEIVQHFLSLIDLTMHRQEQQRLRYLLDELNHRTQNALATVLSIAGQTFKGMADDEVIEAFEGRVLALSKTQGLIGNKIGSGVGLREVLHEVMLPFGFQEDDTPRVLVEGSDVLLQPKQALTFGMLFNELTSNACKHGALSPASAGKVRISWEIEQDVQGKQLRLLWQESGGPVVSLPSRKGFGSRFIERGSAQELDGAARLDYAPTGVTCEILMPWSLTLEGRQP